MDASSFF